LLAAKHNRLQAYHEQRGAGSPTPVKTYGSMPHNSQIFSSELLRAMERNVNLGCTASAARRSGPGEKGLQSEVGLASLADGHGQRRARAKSLRTTVSRRSDTPLGAQCRSSSFSQVSTILVGVKTKPRRDVVDKFSRPTKYRSSRDRLFLFRSLTV
jgi:hypothetical protein